MNSQNKMVYMQKILNPSQYRSNDISTLNKENFTRIMIDSINKAINTNEAPVKEKHVRRLLIGTFQAESGVFFWQNVSIMRLQENQLICWKFCHVLHKLIRDGHKNVLKASYDRRSTLTDCAYMYRFNQDGYGPFIFKYCNLLHNRIVWLKHYPDFPNDLKLSDNQLNEIVGAEPDAWFDFCCELLDRLEELLDLQDAVLTIVKEERCSSLTNRGKCHTAPLIACIQDSSLLYDYSVKSLFKCYSMVDSELLGGHLERFIKLHRLLRKIYSDASNLQYFKTLIQIPHLPEEPPNFKIASNLQRHVAPKVIMISSPAGHDSPDHDVLVNLSDNSPRIEDVNLNASSTSRESQPDSSLETTNQDSVNAFFDQTDDLFDAQTADTIQEADTTLLESEPAISIANEKEIEEYTNQIEQLKNALEAEKEAHSKTKSEREKLQRELSNVRHQLIAVKNDYERLKDECTRAKYESEISNDAMKKLMKDMHELRLKQKGEGETLLKLHQAEVDKREEDTLAAEMNTAEKMIQEAAKKIEELAEKSRKVENGTKLQVNEKIAEVCTSLMVAVRNLIAQSRILQREIVNHDVAKTNSEEFYKRNSEWTNGLISAAQEVATTAKALVDVADRSMSGESKFTELAAAANEIAAATAQLVYSSRAKADKDSEKLKNFLIAARQVNQCTSNVVKASEVCASLVGEPDNEVDLSALSLHQTKQREMESQVKILELEAKLSQERKKLGVLRRQHYEQEEAQETATTSETGTNGKH